LPRQKAGRKQAKRKSSPTAPLNRSEKDEFLLLKKQEGMTYREIRIQGSFTEAESTLRGRYRTLTKSKEERVRKPQWTEKDVGLYFLGMIETRFC
jgi:hypothetical protein